MSSPSIFADRIICSVLFGALLLTRSLPCLAVVILGSPDRPAPEGFAALGAPYKLDGGMVDVQAEQLKGSHIYLDVVPWARPSILFLAAVRAKGHDCIEMRQRAAHRGSWPTSLNSMGADIRGAGTDVIRSMASIVSKWNHVFHHSRSN